MKVISSDQFPAVLMVVLTIIGIAVFWSIMDMVLLGASLAIVLLPLHDRLKTRMRPLFAAILVTLGVWAAFTIAAYITFVIFTANALTLTTIFSTITTWVGDPATNLMAYGVPFSKTTLTTYLSQVNELFIDYQKTIASALPYVIFKAFTFFITLFLLLLHGEELKDRIMDRLPMPLCEYVNRLTAVTVDTLYAIYIVQVIIAVLTFFIALPVFWLLGYGNILFYAFFAAFCELIPILGSSLVFIIVGAYAAALGDTQGLLILFFLGYIGVSLLPEVWIRPVLVGHRVKIHPVIMFIGIIGGLLTMGLAGFVLGPVIVVLLINTYRMYVKERKYSNGKDCSGT